ncbi:MAG: LysR family transcriptional regulator, partial [Burkholderiales bacterium]
MPRFALRRFVRHGMLPQLMVFDAVARLGSVTRAAAELHMAQPTVSTQLKKLADTLELRLFEQRGRQLHLTPAGRALVEICEDLTELLLHAETRLRALRRPEPETVRLAASSG